MLRRAWDFLRACLEMGLFVVIVVFLYLNGAHACGGKVGFP